MSGNKSGKGWKVLSYLLGLAALVLLMMYMAGVFTPNKVPPGQVAHKPEKPPERYTTVKADRKGVTDYYEAVGTVRPRTETTVSAQVTGRIVRYEVSAGDGVEEGDLLVVVDDRTARSRVEEAREGVNSAEAGVAQARQIGAAAEAVYAQSSQEYHRVQKYFEGEAATEQQLEQARSAYHQARANLERANKAVSEARARLARAREVGKQAEIGLGYTKIEASLDGQVVKRLAEPGDLAFPGKPLLSLQTRGTLRLEAVVRESLINRIELGTELDIHIGAVEQTFSGKIEEIVPSGDPMTRTFIVKAGLPSGHALYPGMFGRLMVPVATREVVAVPREAVFHIGQLDVVTIRDEGANGWKQVYVRTGKDIDDRYVEILSGLSGGETLAVVEKRAAGPDSGAAG
ncbi:MAG: efflux RND transporter periplasmic adaptor subunit [Desulfatibacillaceae bacterium]